MMVGWTILQPIGLFVVGPVLDAFGTEPVMIAFALVQTLMMGLAASGLLSGFDRARPRCPSRLDRVSGGRGDDG